MNKFSLSLQNKVCLHTRFGEKKKKKVKRSWLGLKLTFLYTSSAIVEEPKAAVLSKTKPNKPWEAGWELEWLPGWEAQPSAPAPASLQRSQISAQTSVHCQQWTTRDCILPWLWKASYLKTGSNNCVFCLFFSKEKWFFSPFLPFFFFLVSQIYCKPP